LSAAALQEWSRNVENTMRAVAHALNNRATAISAVIELSRDPFGDDMQVTSSILSSELQRVSDLSRIVRTMAPPRSAIEAFTPKDAAAESLVVLQLQVELREHGVTIEAQSAPPVRAARWMFVRALIALGAAASQRSDGAGPVRIAIEGDGDWVVARVEGVAARTSELSPYTAELATAMGGEALENRLGFRLPTLAVLRQREAR
jgi:hypothetical protein